MATLAHCAYSFECLSASFDNRQPLSLALVEELWEQYHTSKQSEDGAGAGASEDEEEEEDDEDADMTDADASTLPAARPAAISRLLNRDTSASTQSASSSSRNSQKHGSGADTPASSTSSQTSRSSLFSFTKRRRDKADAHPLFVTWNTVSRSGYKSLRGCIGTFEPQELEHGLRSYALTRYIT
ncbi:hypothetical protein LTR37_016999 [Vermiconidia calcicola]|uniref:Uncharacterized protein n=1 Tax=Vermiconidia calcicola TaxID=1690605 RepID=A0ACC3MLX5_9PEZI|nr:hypothetical protein LTR37_016999 [Vermiconidia calcicola]